ncbi:MAG: hypothetical protein HUU41_07805 [Bryobacteraceae bacterium]|nr:hypothetical protein [Bryobacterales bacterium]NUN01003.1 hypothetical protein [Bryobacteraceae bacterium]
MRRLLAAALPLFLAGCGSIGDPLPPALNIPERILDLRVKQSGDMLVLDFSRPRRTTEGLVIDKPGTLEVAAGPAGEGEFDSERWAAGARRFEFLSEPAEPSQPIEVPAQEFTGKEILLGVRALNKRGRTAGWSNLVTLRVIAPLPAPSKVQAESAAEGAKVTWAYPEHASGLKFRVYRRAFPSSEMTQAGEVETLEWVDAAAEYGSRYEYQVQALREEGEIRAESDLSPPVNIVPADTFPPAVPSGVIGIPGAGTVELTWERAASRDLQGYCIYRAARDENFVKISGVTETPAYSDATVESGKTYRYAVTSVDRLGNESRRSAPIQITAP